MDSMNLHIDNLQAVLRANGPILKQNFLQYLLEGEYRPADEIAQRLRLFDLPVDYPVARCFLVDFTGVAMGSIPLEKRQVIRLGMVERLNAADPKAGWYCIAGEASEATAVGALCYTDAGRQGALRHVADICEEAFLRLSVGGEVAGLSQLRLSQEQAESTAPYHFFLPERASLRWEEIAGRHESVAALPEDLHRQLEAIPDSPGAGELTARIDRILDELKAGQYSAHYAHSVILELLQALSALASHIPGERRDAARETLYASFSEVDSIHYLRDWAGDYVKSVFAQQEPAQARNTVDQVKEYINENLAGDLSLETVSSQIFISPKYLSRIFKDATGGNLSDYITNRRIEEARRLLVETRLSVEEITTRVGYNSSAYFIKRFKDACGCTPKQYRRTSVEKTG